MRLLVMLLSADHIIIVRRDSSATAVRTESNIQALGDDAEQLPMTTVYMKMFSKLFQLNLIGPCGKLSVSHINACTLHYFILTK